MKYKITITKEIENPNYDIESVKDYNKKSEFGYGGQRPFDPNLMSKNIDVEALKTDLTEVEFDAIKKAVLTVM